MGLWPGPVGALTGEPLRPSTSEGNAALPQSDHNLSTNSFALLAEPPRMAARSVDLLSARLSTIFERETIYCPRMTPEGESALMDVAAAVLCVTSKDEATRKVREVLTENPSLPWQLQVSWAGPALHSNRQPAGRGGIHSSSQEPHGSSKRAAGGFCVYRSLLRR